MQKIWKYVPTQEFIKIDDWKPEEEDKVFKHVKRAIILPIQEVLGLEPGTADFLDSFALPKKGHNSVKIRNHMTHYLNYFEKFYDQDHELLTVYSQIKYIMDIKVKYSEDQLFFDIKRYLFNPSLMLKLRFLNDDNYCLNLTYVNKKEAALQYTNRHAKMLMKLSFMMLMALPLVNHYSYIHKKDTNFLVLKLFDEASLMFSSVDIYSKLYETAYSNISNNEKVNPIWQNQDIRGINVTTHTLASVRNIIVNIIPKYVYNMNIINMNFASIKKNIGYQITDISYEYEFRPLSSTNRDEDNNSEYDKFESYLTKFNESAYLFNKVNGKYVYDCIMKEFGPISKKEYDLYYSELAKATNSEIVHPFQEELVFYTFLDKFSDPACIRSLHRTDYVNLVICAKRYLLKKNFTILPYIVGGRILRLVTKKGLTDQIFTRMSKSEEYKLIIEKYGDNNRALIDYMHSLWATIMASDFSVIDSERKEINGKLINKGINNVQQILEEELMRFTLMI